MKKWVTLLGSFGLFAGLVVSGAQARTLNWAGLQWNCETGYRGPGPNNYSDSTNNIWVDAEGQLHLKITQVSNRWYCAEMTSRDYFHYGEYRFEVASDVTRLDTNVVGGLFNYRGTGASTPPVEIDIEFARQFEGMTPNENTHFGVQPTLGNPGGISTNSRYFYTPALAQSTHRFMWTNTEIYFESYTGHGDPGSGALIAQYTRSASGPAPYPSIPARLHLNLWLFQGKAPTDTQHLELVIRQVHTPPAEPEIIKPIVTNVLEDFEGNYHSPETYRVLWNFDDGTVQGFSRWPWQEGYSFLQADSSRKHSGSYSLRLHGYTDEQDVRYLGISNAVPLMDWSGYDFISFWARADQNYEVGGRPYRMKVKITETSGESWEKSVGLPLSTTWGEYRAYFNQMAYAGETNSNLHILDLTQIARVDLYVDDLQTDGYQLPWYETFYNVDDLQLGRGGDLYDWMLATHNRGYASWSIQTNETHGGSNALEVVQTHDIEASTWLGAWTTNLIERNWSSFSKISFWAKRSVSESDPLNTNHLIKLQFIEGDGDLWEQRGIDGDDPLRNVLSTNWTYYELSFSSVDLQRGGSDWTNAPGNPPGNPPYAPGDNDLSELQRTNTYALRFVFRNPWTNRVSYYVDDIQIFHSGGAPFVSLLTTPTHVGFGAMRPDIADHRFIATNPVVVTYAMENLDPYAYWSIIAYTTNENHQAGIPGRIKPQVHLPLRTWVGTGTNEPPDPEPLSHWTNQWSYLNNEGGFMWPMADSANAIPSGFKLYFAAETMGTYTQEYAGSVTLEFRVE